MTIDYVKPAFRANAFAGTARDYAKYRPPYPKKLIDALLNRVEVTGRNRILDLACGPGRLAIPLTHFFREVWAIDLEPEMIEVGEEKAREGGINNIKWMVGRAEDLEAEKDSFDLITIGEAFHRLDQKSHWRTISLLASARRLLGDSRWFWPRERERTMAENRVTDCPQMETKRRCWFKTWQWPRFLPTNHERSWVQ